MANGNLVNGLFSAFFAPASSTIDCRLDTATFLPTTSLCFSTWGEEKSQPWKKCGRWNTEHFHESIRLGHEFNRAAKDSLTVTKLFPICAQLLPPPPSIDKLFELSRWQYRNTIWHRSGGKERRGRRLEFVLTPR